MILDPSGMVNCLPGSPLPLIAMATLMGLPKSKWDTHTIVTGTTLGSRRLPAPRAMSIARRPSVQVSADSCDLFDLQVNGFAGVDFQQLDLRATDLRKAVKTLRSRRTGRILLTLITDRISALCKKLERIERIRRKYPDVAATVAGYHIEGPYLLACPGYSGAHDARLMGLPKVMEFEQLWDASGGNIRLFTLAPELPGSAEFIRHVVRRGVRVAIGHSDADDRSIDEAIAAGLSLCTHLGNGVPNQVHRHQNVIQRLLARDELFAAFIPDGIHLPPHVLQNFVRAKLPERVFFTTDGMAAAGAPPGSYRLGKLTMQVGPDGIVRQPGHEGYFAGSSLTMDAAVLNVQSMVGWSRAAATAACSNRVARFLGFPDA
jgi:N-acetylglucosamine-6-phosphate deacetylase